MTGRPARFNKRTQLVAVSLTVFCWLGIWTLFYSVPLFFQAGAQTLPSAGASPQSDPPARAESAADIESKSKDLDHQRDYVEKLLGALVTVGTIFGLALGLASYMNLKELQQNAEKTVELAEKTVARVKAQAEKDLAEIRADFPAIARMNRQVEKILAELKSVVFREWNQTSYNQLEERERQEIILLEFAFRNVLTLFEHQKNSSYSRMMLEIQRGFGRFYSSRYTSSTGADPAARARAILYLESASVLDEPDIYADVQGDFGILYALHSGFASAAQKAGLRNLASECLQRALEHDAKNPRFLQVMAWIERHDGHLDAAIRHLDTIIGNLNARPGDDPDRRRYLLRAQYNRACYRVQRAKDLALANPAKASDEEGALQDLTLSHDTALLHDELKDWHRMLNKDLTSLWGSEPGDLAPTGGASAIEVRILALVSPWRAFSSR